MEMLSLFIITVAADVVCYFICKWLDGKNKKGN